MINEQQIRVMIIDDSALIRNVIAKILSQSDAIQVVGTAINGNFGLKKINSLKPDIIILDLEMPDMNGIEFLKERNRLGIKTPVIILSAHAKKGAKITLDALALGASDFVLKPEGSNIEIEKTKNKLTDMIIALAKPNTYQPCLTNQDISFSFKAGLKLPEPPKLNIETYLKSIKTIPDIKLIAIGISTGGPNALRQILPLFPPSFPVPIIIVQHMPAGFTLEFAKSLNNLCSLEVKEAEENDIIKPGRIFIAPGNKQLTLVPKKLATVIHLDDSEPVNGHKPSVDVLFRSAAAAYGANIIGCIMTGMGKDGAENIGQILSKGGITIAQDQASSIVFGMPRIAIEKGNIQLVYPLDQIAQAIINIVINRTVI